MADREIRLVGSFKDDITPKLKKLSAEIDKVVKSFGKMQAKLRPIAKEMGVMSMATDRVTQGLRSQRSAMESSIRTMQQVRRESGGLNKANRSVATGLNMQKASIDSSVRAMNQYRTSVGKVIAAQKKLKPTLLPPATALPRPAPMPMPMPRGGVGGGRGGGGSMTGAAAAGAFLGGGALMAVTGAASVIGNSVRGVFGFVGDRFKEAMEDEISDIQAQGAIFGVLRKEGLVADYKVGKQIAKTLDIEIAKMVASSPIPTATITTLNRTLSDTFLPGLMKGFKAEGQSTFDAARNSAKQLAGFYEQIGYLTPPNYPIGMVTKGITKLIESGRITGELAQIDFFQLNPQLIPTLKKKNFEQAKTIMERMKILQEAMSVVMPPEAMAEIRTSLSAGMQGIQDNLTNVSVGLLSFGAEMKEAMDVSYVYKDLKTGEMVTAFKKVTTPLQLISAKLAPVLSELGNVLGQMSDKLGPVTVHLAKAFAQFFGPALQDLTRNLAGIADAIEKGDLKDMGEIIGKVVGNMLKALSQGMEAIGDTKGPMGDFLRSFTNGLNSVFPPEAQTRLAMNLESAFSNLLSKIVEFAAPPLAALLVSTIKSFIVGLFNAGPIGAAILGIGALKTGLPQKAAQAVTAPGGMGPGRIAGRPQVLARQGINLSRQTLTSIGGTFKAAIAAPKGAIAGGGLAQSPLSALGGAAGKNFMAGLKAISPKLLIIGGVLTTIISLFEGKSILEAISTGLSSAGGSAIGAAIGTVIFPGVGTAIGAAIGGWLGSLQPVVDFVQGSFMGIWEALSTAFGSVGEIFAQLGALLGDMWNAFTGMYGIIGQLIPGLGNMGQGINWVQAGLIAFKVILTPLVAGLQLLHMGVLGLRLAFVTVDKFINQIFQAGDRQGRLAAQQAQIMKEMGEAHKTNMKYYSTPAPRTSPTTPASQAPRAAAPRPVISASQAPRAAAPRPVAPAAPVTSPAPTTKPAPNPIPAIQALNAKQAEATAHLSQINAKVGAQKAANPIPQLSALNVKQAGANAFLAQLKTQMVASANVVKGQIGASSNAQQAKIQGVTNAVNVLSSKFQAGMPVRVINQPTVKFAMGMGPIGGGIGKFPKTSGYGPRWGRMHSGNDYGMPVGTKLGLGGPGKVLFAGAAGAYGNMVDIGGPGGMVYRFAHLSKINAPVGATLPPGYPFALSGNTGRSTGPHLHFEARPGGGGAVNPDPFAGMIRAGYAGMGVGPLMDAAKLEMSKMPYGAQLAVRNTDEVFMKPMQMANLVESSTKAGAEGRGNISMSGVTINVNGVNKNSEQIAEEVAAHLLTAMYKASYSNDGRQG